MTNSASPRERKCPICSGKFSSRGVGDGCFPFCSSRCQHIDLGRWLSGDYVIATPLTADPQDPETQFPPIRRQRDLDSQK